MRARMEGTVASKGKVVVVMGATATGEVQAGGGPRVVFGGKVINSDKIQVYDGLDLISNKVTTKEHYIVRVLTRGHVRIVDDGLNRYLASAGATSVASRDSKHTLIYMLFILQYSLFYIYIKITKTSSYSYTIINYIIILSR
jgi:hypothetical protein